MSKHLSPFPLVLNEGLGGMISQGSFQANILPAVYLTEDKFPISGFKYLGFRKCSSAPLHVHISKLMLQYIENIWSSTTCPTYIT